VLVTSWPMGQPVRVVEKPSSAQLDTIRYETNRPLSGMGHRSYTSGDDATSDLDPADELAKLLFARDGVENVHVNGSVITVKFARDADTNGITGLIEGLFLHYT